MKILVLMPLDERCVPAATAIYQALPKEVKDITFAIPMYMEYLVKAKIEGSWEEAVVRSLFSSKKLLDVLKPEDDYILIGNAPKDFKFDAIFNFQDIDKSLPYKDVFLDKVKSIFNVDEEPLLKGLLGNLYSGESSTFSLHNCIATADFLAKYIKTINIEETYNKVIKEYQKIVGE